MLQWRGQWLTELQSTFATFDLSQPRFSLALLRGQAASALLFPVRLQVFSAYFKRKHKYKIVQIGNQLSWYATQIIQFWLVIYCRWLNKWAVTSFSALVDVFVLFNSLFLLSVCVCGVSWVFSKLCFCLKAKKPQSPCDHDAMQELMEVYICCKD